ILRLSACVGVPIDLIGPAGFDFSDRSFRRAGLDYLDHVDITRHDSFAAFAAGLAAHDPPPRLVLLTTHAPETHLGFAFRASDVLLLGRESAGVPDAVHNQADARVRIPMRPGLRSLNIAVAAAMVLGEALRQTNGFPGERGLPLPPRIWPPSGRVTGMETASALAAQPRQTDQRLAE